MKNSRCSRKKLALRKGHTLILVAIMLPLLIGMVGLVVDGGLLLASYERAQNIADATARSVAISLHQGADSSTLQGTGEEFAFTHNNLPDDPGLSSGEQVIVNNPPENGPFKDDENYVEVLITHPMDTNFIQVLGPESHRRVTARAVAGFRKIPAIPAGLLILDPAANPGLSISGTNASLQVGIKDQVGIEDEDASIVVYTRRVGENEYGATTTVYDIPGLGGQPAVTVGGSGATIKATEIFVSGGVDDWQNYVEPDVGALHAGTGDPIDDPFHDTESPLPVPTVGNGVINRDLGSVRITAGGQTGLISPNTYDPIGRVTTLHPGIYHEISISGGTVVFKPGIYVLQQTKGGGNVMSVTGGRVDGAGVMFYNTGANWNVTDGGTDSGDLSELSETRPYGVQNEHFGGINLQGSEINFSGIDVENGAFDYSGMSGISVFQDMVIYQRRFNDTPISITDGASFPKGVTGKIYAKWAPLNLSGQGTYNFAIIVGRMSVSGNATVTVQGLDPIETIIEPVRLVE